MFDNDCDEFHPLIQEDNIYEFRNMLMKPTNSNFNNLGTLCELCCTQFTEIRKVEDSDLDVSHYKSSSNFQTLEEIEMMPKGTLIDVKIAIKEVKDAVVVTNETS